KELQNLATTTRADVLAMVDPDGHQFAVAGTNHDQWDSTQSLTFEPAADTFQQVIVQRHGAFRVNGARLRFIEGDLDETVGTLIVGTSLDANYAQELSNLSNAGIVIVVGNTVLARTVSEPVALALAGQRGMMSGTTTLDDEEY